mgnify:CR=1 FL=1|jgi:hypothetical protein
MSKYSREKKTIWQFQHIGQMFHRVKSHLAVIVGIIFITILGLKPLQGMSQQTMNYLQALQNISKKYSIQVKTADTEKEILNELKSIGINFEESLIKDVRTAVANGEYDYAINLLGMADVIAEQLRMTEIRIVIKNEREIVWEIRKAEIKNMMEQFKRTQERFPSAKIDTTVNINGIGWNYEMKILDKTTNSSFTFSPNVRVRDGLPKEVSKEEVVSSTHAAKLKQFGFTDKDIEFVIYRIEAQLESRNSLVD